MPRAMPVSVSQQDALLEGDKGSAATPSSREEGKGPRWKQPKGHKTNATTQVSHRVLVPSEGWWARGAFLFELPPKKPTVGISAPTVAAAKICSLFLKQPRLLIPTACTDMGTCPSI